MTHTADRLFLVHTAYTRRLCIPTSEMVMAKEKNSTKTSRDQRLNFRASARQELMIRRAAEATDSTITDFILGSVMESAERVLTDRTWFVADEEQWAEFQRLLDAPLPPMPRLDRLRRRVSPFDESDAATLG